MIYIYIYFFLYECATIGLLLTSIILQKYLIVYFASATKRHIVWIFISQEPLTKQSNHITYALL